MRRRQLKGLWKRLKELQGMELKRDALLMKLGAAKQQAPSAWRLVKVQLPAVKQKRRPGQEEQSQQNKLEFSLRKGKLREVRRREGRYLLRTNMTEKTEVQLW